MDSTRTPALKNKPNGYGKWEKHVEYISGIQFLSHEINKEKYLVTVNGGLVPLKKIRPRLEAYLKTEGLLADFPPVMNSELDTSAGENGYLPGTEKLRQAGKTHIDGVKVTADAAPLMCLDLNILSGLRAPGHKIVMDMIGKCPAGEDGKKPTLFSLNRQPGLRDYLLSQIPPEDAKRRRMVEIAYETVNTVTQKMDEAKEGVFAGKHSVTNSKLFVSMGGAGSGKTAVEEMAKAQCGENFVVASLDEFRKKSDMYTLLTAAGHHGDDYVVVEPFANNLREWVATHARDNKINAMYDGTGVVYDPRYAKTVKEFKDAGFTTNVIAVDAPMEKAIGLV
ncbi:MAG: zeta toxin family protein, partial [Rickettsiales bacterium]|nr:zeta toxin family protein [Rickettsiales bacterium]